VAVVGIRAVIGVSAVIGISGVVVVAVAVVVVVGISAWSCQCVSSLGRGLSIKVQYVLFLCG
jgi:hypothetical protein